MNMIFCNIESSDLVSAANFICDYFNLINGVISSSKEKYYLRVDDSSWIKYSELLYLAKRLNKFEDHFYCNFYEWFRGVNGYNFEQYIEFKKFGLL
jgi:hypothetical protein